ncbi:MAG: hypothetical protein M3O67_10015 [Bacteroidota bacterium]|nr:hypothetical protein [Bacteroidota bacterium]
MNPNRQSNKNYNDLWRYAGLTMQIFIALGLGVFIGLRIDKWLNFSVPVLVLILPLLMLSGLIYKLIKETSKRK